MKTKRVNAGIKSAEEAYRRMLDGEVFYHKDRFTLWYEAGRFCLQDSEESSGPRHTACLNGNSSLSEWEVDVEYKWYEDIPANGVICWVGDKEPDIQEYDRVDIIYSTEAGPCFMGDRQGWKYATPVKASELLEE